MFAVC